MKVFIEFYDSIPVRVFRVKKDQASEVEWLRGSVGDDAKLVTKEDVLLLVAREKNERRRDRLKNLLKEML